MTMDRTLAFIVANQLIDHGPDRVPCGRAALHFLAGLAVDPTATSIMVCVVSANRDSAALGSTFVYIDRTAIRSSRLYNPIYDNLGKKTCRLSNSIFIA